jgi:hypothetical protein
LAVICAATRGEESILRIIVTNTSTSRGKGT